MTDQKYTAEISSGELLSALVDGELSDAEIQQLLEVASPELLQRWSRYHLAKDAINQHTAIHQPVEMLANISAAIADESKRIIAATPKVNSFDESLSALVDGEVSELELRRILKTDSQDAFRKLGRYYLASNILRQEVNLAKAIDVSSDVSAAIDQVEEVLETPVKPALWVNLGRFGIAASVAGALVVGVQFLSISEPQNIASNPASVSGDPILGSENAVRVVGNEVPVKSTEKIDSPFDENNRTDSR